MMLLNLSVYVLTFGLQIMDSHGRPISEGKRHAKNQLSEDQLKEVNSEFESNSFIELVRSPDDDKDSSNGFIKNMKPEEILDITDRRVSSSTSVLPQQTLGFQVNDANTPFSSTDEGNKRISSPEIVYSSEFFYPDIEKITSGYHIPLEEFEKKAKPYISSIPYNMEGSEIPEPSYIVPKNNKTPIEKSLLEPSFRSTNALIINDRNVRRYEIKKDNGEFISSFISLDGTKRSDLGELKKKKGGGQVLVTRGTYSFTSPEGRRFRVDYTADERGYRAKNVPEDTSD